MRAERGNCNRETKVTNQRLRQLKARISKLQSWPKEEAANTEPSTLAHVLHGILSRREQAGRQSRYAAVNNLKATAHMLNFLSANDIKDMAELKEKITNMFSSTTHLEN